MLNINKGKMKSHNQSDLMGQQPPASIGPDRMGSILGKLKKKKVGALRAVGSSIKSGIKANAGAVAGAIGKFVNR